MPHVKQLSRIGNSRGIILDRVLLNQADIDPDGEVELTVHDGTIVITPHRYANDSKAAASFRKIATSRRRLMTRLAK